MNDEVRVWTVAVGNLPTPLTPRRARKDAIRALRFIMGLEGFIGFHPVPPEGTLCLFRTENNAKGARNLMRAAEIQVGRNIGEVFIERKYLPKEETT